MAQAAHTVDIRLPKVSFSEPLTPPTYDWKGGETGQGDRNSAFITDWTSCTTGSQRIFKHESRHRRRRVRRIGASGTAREFSAQDGQAAGPLRRGIETIVQAPIWCARNIIYTHLRGSEGGAGKRITYIVAASVEGRKLESGMPLLMMCCLPLLPPRSAIAAGWKSDTVEGP